MTYNDVNTNRELKTYIRTSDNALAAKGYTEHSFRHAKKVANDVGVILQKMGYDERTIELGKIAGYMHDIGNMINRSDHAHSGAMMAFNILLRMGFPAEDVARVVVAIGNHDEKTGIPVSEIAAALILADKSDVRRSRVRNRHKTNFDIHDRVNFATRQTEIEIDSEIKKVKLHVTIDTEICPITDYFEIFLQRMILCRRASEFLGWAFGLYINDVKLM